MIIRNHLVVVAASLLVVGCATETEHEEETATVSEPQTSSGLCVASARTPVWFGDVYSIADVSSYYSPVDCFFRSGLQYWDKSDLRWHDWSQVDIYRHPRAPNIVVRSPAGVCHEGWYRTYVDVDAPGRAQTREVGPMQWFSCN
jgi:hypothetical protein